jgi:hypothetical protein
LYGPQSRLQMPQMKEASCWWVWTVMAALNVILYVAGHDG